MKRFLVIVFLTLSTFGCSPEEPNWKFKPGSVDSELNFSAIDKLSGKEATFKVCGIQALQMPEYKEKAKKLMLNLFEKGNKIQILSDGRKSISPEVEHDAEIYISASDGKKINVAEKMVLEGLASYDNMAWACINNQVKSKALSANWEKAIEKKRGIHSDQAQALWEKKYAKDYRETQRSEIVQITQGIIWDLESEIERLKKELKKQNKDY